jgi:hypothetical protein
MFGRSAEVFPKNPMFAWNIPSGIIGVLLPKLKGRAEALP